METKLVEALAKKFCVHCANDRPRAIESGTYTHRFSTMRLWGDVKICRERIYPCGADEIWKSLE